MPGPQPPPFTTFDGFLKCHRPHHANEQGRLLMAAAFPGFIDAPLPTEEQLRARWPATPQTGGAYYGAIERRYRRRYAGDTLDIRRLSRGSYYTVCLNQRGEDNQTLANEMNAYRDATRGLNAFAVDMADPRASTDGSTLRAVDVFVEFPANHLNPGTDDLARGLGLDPQAMRRNGIRMRIPYEVERTVIPNVIDLRLPHVQGWLWESMRDGDGDVLTVHRMDKQLGSFFTMLPTMLNRQHGGNDVTNAIGTWLMKIGASALVFPSARSNVRCGIVRGEMKMFWGWNLVDFRGSPLPACQKYNVVGDWESKGMPGRVTLGVAPPESEEAGTWDIIGLPEAYNQEFKAAVQEHRRLYHLYPMDVRSSPMTVARIRELLGSGAVSRSTPAGDYGAPDWPLPYSVGSLVDGPYPPEPAAPAAQPRAAVAETLAASSAPPPPPSSPIGPTASEVSPAATSEPSWEPYSWFDRRCLSLDRVYDIRCYRCGWKGSYLPLDDPYPWQCPACGWDRGPGGPKAAEAPVWRTAPLKGDAPGGGAR
jgi:hypothetical protein